VLSLHTARVNLNTADAKAFCFAFGMDCKALLRVKENDDPYPLPSKFIEILTLLLFQFSTFILVKSSDSPVEFGYVLLQVQIGSNLSRKYCLQ